MCRSLRRRLVWTGANVLLVASAAPAQFDLASELERAEQLLAARATSAPAPQGAGGGVLYVDGASTGPVHDGTTWCSGFVYLQDALAAAAGAGGAISEIRVAAGIHTPDRGAGQTPLNKNATFNLLSGVTLRGGYAGCLGSNADARDFQAYETTLSGDLQGNDAPGFVNYGDNSCNVAKANQPQGGGLDGITITGGGGSGSCAAGGGLNSIGATMIVRSCVFRDNKAIQGGAVLNLADGSDYVNCTFLRNRAAGSGGAGGAVLSLISGTRYTNCTFIDNEAPTGSGGAVYQQTETVVLGGGIKFSGCRFLGNTATRGGAVSVLASGPDFVNCTFSGNTASSNDGGAVANASSSESGYSKFVNCTFSGNTAGGFGAVMVNNAAAPTITHCVLWNNTDSVGAGESSQVYNVSLLPVVNHTCMEGWSGALGGLGNFSADPRFVNAAGADGVAGTEDDDLRLQSDSPCLDAGDNARIGLDVTDLDADGNTAEGVPFDVDGLLRVQDGDGNQELAGIPATIDLGAHERAEVPGPNPPRIIAVAPPPGEWVTDGAGLTAFSITFDQNVSVPAGAVAVRGATAGAIDDFTTHYDGNSRTLAVLLATAIRDERVTLVLDFSTVDVLGRALDGEIANPSNAALPSGDGVAGGQAVFRVNVLQGDANHDGIVDVYDRAIIRAALGSSTGDVAYNALADLNHDGHVNALDAGLHAQAEGRSLPPADGAGPYVTSLSPDPAFGLSTDLDAVTVYFNEPIAAGMDRRTCHLIDGGGVIRTAATIESASDGRSATFRFSPALSFCADYSVRISNAPGDATDMLLVTPAAIATLSGLSAPPPAVVLDEPDPLITGNPVVTVNGSAQPGAVIAVSGHGGVCGVFGETSCEIAANPDGTFSIDVSPAVNHVNHVHFSAISSCNGQSSAPVVKTLTHDVQDPFVYIDYPIDGAEITTGTIDVAGRVADALSGFMGLTVLVNGVAADVDEGIGTNGTFFRPTVPLVSGANVITVIAGDAVGNSSQHQATVTRVAVDPEAPVMTVDSGNAQSAPVHGLLGSPIVVRVMDGDGTPFADKVVTFRVTRSDGLLSADPPLETGDGTRTLQVRTDAAGLAGAYWQLGTDAGSGNNRAEAVSGGVAGTVLFCASATPGPVRQINIGSGNNQRAEAGADAPLPLRAWVSDGCNGIVGQAVKFQVIRGDGRVNGQNTVVIPTLETGHVEVNLTLGFTAGTNIIEASLVEPPGTLPVKQPARFQAYGLARDQVTTSFAGVVLNNGGQPLEGAEVILTVTGQFYGPIPTDADGRFHFDNIVDYGAAFLYINGASATHVGGPNCPPPDCVPPDCIPPDCDVEPGTYPFLTYDTLVVPNAANSLAAPVMLPPLNPLSRVLYDGTTDVELQVMTDDPETPGQPIVAIEGLKMLVKAGSVTLRDGVVPSPASPAYLSLNQVHEDDIPMPIPDGASPPFAWTLQPAGARFDPPIAITYPNMTGLPPGSIAYFLTFNHDSARFEIVASGHVTEDGSSIVSDPGDGLALAGWGCNCPPYSVTGDCCSGGCDDDCCEGTCCGCSCCTQKCCGGECCFDCCGGECCDGECCNDVCCDAGEICCDGECFKGELCNGECCEGECCDGVCCPEGGTCCAGECCDGPCCPETGECCPASAKSCCDNECCDGPCCEETGECCPASDKSCCNNECCEGLCCNDVCCAAGDESCCNDSCCEGPCCQNNCCSSGESCCGPFCCESGKSCCNSGTGLCCDPGTSCCNGEDCCEPDEQCCNGTCCPPDQMCCNGLCRPVSCSFSVEPGHGCPGNTIQLELTGTCRPPCWSMAPAPREQPPYATVGVLGSIPCDNEPHTIMVSVTIHDDAPVGSTIVFTLEATAPNGTKCQASGSVVVENANLIFDGLPEETEEDPGGVLCVNNDDDDFDGKADKLYPEPVEGENDLRPLVLTIGTLPPGGTATLTGGSSRVRVYEGSEKVGLVSLPASYPSSELPKTLWVEGVQASSAARDVSFELQYTPPGGQPCKDRVKLSVGEVEFTDTNAPEYTGGRYEQLDLVRRYSVAPEVRFTTTTVPSSSGAAVATLNGTVKSPIAPLAAGDVSINGDAVTTLTVTNWGANNLGPFEQSFGLTLDLHDFDQCFKAEAADAQSNRGWDKLIAVANYDTGDGEIDLWDYSGDFTGRTTQPDEPPTPAPSTDAFSFTITVVDPLEPADVVTVDLSTGIDATQVELQRTGPVTFSGGPFYVLSESAVLPPGTLQEIMDARVRGRLGFTSLATHQLYLGPTCEDTALVVGGELVNAVNQSAIQTVEAGLPKDAYAGSDILMRGVIGLPGDINGLPMENGVPYLDVAFTGRDYRDAASGLPARTIRHYRQSSDVHSTDYNLFKSSTSQAILALASPQIGADPAGTAPVAVESGGFLKSSVNAAGVTVQSVYPVRGPIVVNVLIDGLGAGFPRNSFAPFAPPNLQTFLEEAPHLVPNLVRMVGDSGHNVRHYNGNTTFPSITYSAWASWATGQDPGVHGVTGSNFYVRNLAADPFWGGISEMRWPFEHVNFHGPSPIFDLDAAQVWHPIGTLNSAIRPNVPTLYEAMNGHGLVSAVVYQFVHRGATYKQFPVDPLGILTAEELGVLYHIPGTGKADDLSGTRTSLLTLMGSPVGQAHIRAPQVLTVYFPGLDNNVHNDPGYLTLGADHLKFTDRMLGSLTRILDQWNLFDGTRFTFTGDHGLTDAVDDDVYSLVIETTTELEMEAVTYAAQFDILDIADPIKGEYDAVIGFNGGMAHVYVRHRISLEPKVLGTWSQPPNYTTDVRPLAEKIYDNSVGVISGSVIHPELIAAVELVLVRNSNGPEGFNAPYEILYRPGVWSGDFTTVPIANAAGINCGARPMIPATYVNLVAAIDRLRDQRSGDIILLSNLSKREANCIVSDSYGSFFDGGRYFGDPLDNWHGSAYDTDMTIPIIFSFPAGQGQELTDFLNKVNANVPSQPGPARITDIVPTVYKLLTEE